LSTQFRKAREDGDQQAARALQQKMGELTRGRQKITEAFSKQLEDVLTPEQMVKARRLLGLRPPPPPPDALRMLFALRGMDLTAEQKAKVAKILDGALKSIQGEVLSEEQRKQLEQFARTGGRSGRRNPREAMGALLGRLDLTDEQKKQVEAIQRETAEKARKAGSQEERRKLISGLQKRIYGEVLTDEQRARLQGMRRGDRSGRPKPDRTRRSRER
jgi:Spy/CpxP family protein refolding chaperone